MSPETHLMVIQMAVKLTLMGVILAAVLGLFVVNALADALLRRLPLTVYSQTSIQFLLVIASVFAIYWIINNVGDVLRYVLLAAQE